VAGTGQNLIDAHGVGLVIDGHRILHSIDLGVAAGEVLALVGPNGAGKSTLLSVLSGDVAPTEGSVTVAGRDLGSYRHLELARERSVLTQDNQLSFPFTVGQVVLMGRSPWARTANFEDDELAVAEAMVAMDIDQLATRRYTSLSGGEKARVSLARVLAQRTQIVLLDEPTAALDLRHQEDVMHAVRGIAATGRAVLVVVHDLSLAAAFADRIAIVDHGALVAVGTPGEVLTAERVSGIYGLPVTVTVVDGRPVILPTRQARRD
jgi:iron complex transport system ATP-binding protein